MTRKNTPVKFTKEDAIKIWQYNFKMYTKSYDTHTVCGDCGMSIVFTPTVLQVICHTVQIPQIEVETDGCTASTCSSASGGKSMELRVSTDSILRCRGPLRDWDMESVLAREASSPSINSPPPSPPPSPSSELEPPSPERRDRRSPDCRFCRLSDGARPRLFQLDRRLVRPLPELHGA